MFSTDDHIEKYDRAARAALPGEDVVAAVQVGRAGGNATLVLSQVSGLAGIASMMRQKQRAAGLPQLFFLAVTPDRLHVLSTRSGIRPKAGRVLRSWDRGDVLVRTSRVLGGTKLVLDVADGTHIECQGPEGELSARVVRALERGTVAA